MRKFIRGVAVFLICFFATTTSSYATHLMGGEITWECNGTGEYVFTFKVYRDCSGNAISPNASGLIQIHNYPTTGSVTQIPPSQWTTISDADISPNCSGPGSFSCANGDDESVFEYIRSFTRRLNGTPPPQGWIITYDDNARNANDNLQGQPGLTLRAKILPYTGQVADTCLDSSPKFRELATSLICVGIPFSYNHNATDDELDSLVYEWAQPLNVIGTGQLYVEGSVPSALAFQNNYSFTSPFPGIAQDVRNVPATLDPNTGEISLTSFTSGKFVSCIKVTAYKCGDAVAEIYRELQANLATSPVCSSNDKPIVRPPFQDGNGNFTVWNDTVRAGDLVSFNIQIQDFASIAQNGGDSVTLLASGLQFGANFTSSTTGCINPPCATLTSTLPQTGFLGVSNSFNWQTDCNHTSFTDQCVSGQNTYTFVITAIDNRCPLPLKNVGTISITVLADSVILSPLIHCVDVQPNGDVQLDWNVTPNINNSFSAWMIYTATAENGPYSLLDSVKTYNTSTYTHTGANAQNERRWYYIRSRSGCKGIVQNVARDTVSTIFIDPVTNALDVSVNWNKLTDPNPTGSASQYRLFREYPVGGSLNFFQNVTGETFTDNFPNCADSVRYRVDLVNTAEACTSRSNTLLYNVQFPEPTAGFTFAPPNPCVNTNVSFTNTTVVSSGTVSYRWDFGDGSAFSAVTSPTHVYTSTGSFDVELIAFTPKGCRDTITQTIVIGLPTADAGGDQTICPGGNVQIGGAPTGPVGSTFLWAPAASLNNASIANPTASPTVTTIYTVTVTDGNGCTNTDQVTVNVNTVPTADAGPDQSLCIGSSVGIGGAPTGPVGATYLWDNATSLDDPTIANPTATPTVTTIYTVTVSTGINCTATDQVTITVNPSPSINAGADQSVCLGNGVTIGNNATGGTPNYTYSWSPSIGLSASNIAMPIANPTATTTYTVTVTDASGCTADDQITITVNSATANAGGNFSICDGSSVIIGGASAGTPPLTFAWDNGASLSATNVGSPLASPTTTTTYTLTVTDANGCTDTDQSTVTVNSIPVADAGADQTICPGNSANIGTAAAAGNTYAWDNAASLSSSTVANPVASPTVTTTYTVTVTTTASGCTNTDQVTITVNPGATADAGADQSLCLGQSVVIGGTSGGTAPLTYAWSNAASLSSSTVANPTATPTSTTTYTLTVTDADGCTDTDDVTVTVIINPSADAGSNQTICAGAAATLGGSPTGPAGSTFLWDNAASLNNASLANPIAIPSVTTTYTVTVTSGVGCTATDQVTITVDPLPTADAGPDQTICSLSAAFIGGAPTSSTPGATFAWDNAASLNNATVANPIATPTVTTTYTVTVTHPNGCTATDQVLVSVNSLPTADAGADQFICDGGSIQIGGAPTGPAGATFNWDNGGTLNNATLANPTANPTTTTIYTVTVTDGNGCTSTDQVTVTVGTLPTADAGADFSACPDAVVSLGGAPTGPVGATYNWSPSANLNDATLANPDFTVDATTTFTVTVTDGSGCSSTDQITVTAFPRIIPDAGPDQVICDGNSVVIGGTSTGGSAPLTYAWDNAASLNNATLANPTASPTVTTVYTVTVSDANGCSQTDDVTVTVNSLPTADAGADQNICAGSAAFIGGSPTGPVGATYAWDNAASLNDATAANPIATPAVTTTYTVTVTNGNGCTDTDQVVVTVDPLPDADAGADQTICSGQSATIGGAPTSSVGGATFAWDNGASLNDATASNPVASPTTTTVYTVTVSHPNGCTATDQVTVTVNSLPTADAGADQFICDGTSATIGGAPTGPVGSTFAWDNAASLNDATLANPVATPTVTTTYTVTVTDGNGCTNTDLVLVTVGSLPVADAGADQLICENSSTSIGGAPTGPVGSSFLWDNAGTLDDATLANPTASPLVTTTYTVTVTDGSGCSSTDQVLVTVDPQPTADAGPDQVICDLQAAFIGGAPTSSTPGATFAWDNATSLNDATAANPVATPSVTTTYTLTVTHPNGCTNTDQVVVTVNALPTADAGADQTICTGESAILGGSPTGPAGSTFAWDNAADLDDATLANPTASPAATTTYTVTVTDGNGCTNTDQITITVNPIPDADAGADQTICENSSVSIGGSPTSSVAGASFAWDNATSLDDVTLANPTATPLVTTTYTVTVSHPNGCTNTDQVVITVNPAPLTDAGPDQAICILQSVAIGGSPTGPAGSTFAWDNAADLDDATLANPTATPSVTTTYTVTVTDGNGCTNTDAVTITVNPLPLVDAGPDQSICDGTTANLGGSPTGPAGSSYAWDNATSLNDATLANPTASPTATTTYTVTVTDLNGCTNTDQIVITVDPLPNVDAGPDQNICDLQSVTIGGSPTSSTVGATFAWDNAASLNDATLANPTASPTVTTTYTVTVSHPNGCSATDQVLVTVNPLPVVDAGADQDICIGQSTTIGGSPTGPAGSTFAWDNAASLNDATLANPTASPTVTTTYTVTVTDGNGCTNTDAVVITVNPLPSADAGPDQAICDLQSATIGGSPTSSSPGATFLWDNATTLNSATLANPIATPSVTTTYTLTVTDPNGCTNTDQVVITVNPLPTADAGPDLTMCDLESRSIGGAPTSTTPGVNYLWDNAASLNDATLANPVATPSVTTTYTVTVTDVNGCSSVDAMTLTVNPLPSADAGADQLICEGDIAILGGTPTGPAGTTFAWDNGTSLDDATLANPTATPTVTTTYTVTVTDGNGCTNTDQIVITVNPVPNVDAGPDFTICDVSSITIGGSPTSSTVGATFLWDNASTLSDATVANPTASPTVTTTYTVTVTHPNACTATDQMTITVNPLPVADAGIDAAICVGQSQVIGGAPTGPGGATYLWDNATTLDDATLANPTASPTVTTTYTVTVTDLNGCTGTDDVVITVNPLPTVDAGVSPQAICLQSSITLGGSPTSTAPNAFYAWDNVTTLNDPTAANPIATPTITTTYTVTVTDQNGCTNTGQIQIIVNPLPTADAGPDQAICDGESVQIGGAPTSTTPNVTYLWDNAADLDDASSPNPTATPTVTTTYTVTVTDVNSCTKTSQVIVTVNPLPVANAGVDQVICENDTITIGGTPTGPTTATYLWNNTASLDDSTAANPRAFPSVTTVYVVTVTDVTGCTGTDLVLVTVNPAPAVDAGADQTICQKDSVMIGGAPTGPAGATFLWTPADGLSDPTVANPMASPDDTTAYVVRITDGIGCNSFDTVVVNVNELPQVDFNIDATCFGDFAAFTDQTSLNSSTIQSWSWNFGDGTGTSVLQNPAYQYGTPGDYNVKLIVTTNLGCVDSVEKTITINALPLANAGPDVALCEGDSVRLGGMPTGPSDANYSWSPAIGLSNANDSTPFAYPLITTEYYLSVTDLNGCINYDTVEVTVNTLPTVISTPDTSICKGGSVQLNASGAVAYTWVPADFLNDPQIANPIASPQESVNYVVFGTDGNGCIDTDTTFIRVFNIDFEPNDTSVCYGDSIQLSVEIDVIDPTTVSYVWSPSLGLDDPTAANPMASPFVTTKYQVRVEDPRGCVDVDSLLLRIDPIPNVSFEYVVSPRCENAVLELTNTSTFTDTYLWKLNGIPSAEEFQPRFELDYTVENTITLIGTNDKCSDSTMVVIPAMTFDEIFKFKDANVFTPNNDGINDIFNPGFEGEFVGCVEFLVFDRWGDKVFDSNIGVYGWDGRTMKGGNAPIGTYFYVVRIGSREIRGSIYLQR